MRSLYDECVTHYDSKNTQTEEGGKVTEEPGRDTDLLTVGDATPTVTSENTPSEVNTLGRCSVQFTLHFKE